MSRIDSHQHFWRYDEQAYGWMSDRHGAIRKDFMPDDLQPLLRRNGFDGSIAVQARQTLQETEWLLELADLNPEIKGVVGWVDLRASDVDRQLERYAAHPRFVGVRHVLHDEPDDAFMSGADFRRGIAALERFRLTYDLLLYPKHLKQAAMLAKAFPNQPFVVDHLAKPAIASGGLSPWREQLAELAAYPNVYCKASGMVTEAEWGQWEEADFAPYLDVVFSCFGTDRVMIGSDWPVCTLSGTYDRTMNIVASYAERFSPEDQALILGGNCARFYGIGNEEHSI